MYRLIYASQSVNTVEIPMIKDILEKARSRNERSGVTGALFYNFQYFLQCLEGNRENVNRIFGNICGDERHKNIEIISAKDTECRLFSEWSMCISSATEVNANIYFDFLPTKEFNPYLLTDKSAEEFIIRLKDKATTL